MSVSLFNVAAEGANAWGQAGYLIGALVCLGIGGLLLGNWLYWRLHAEKVTGQIIGTRIKNGYYHTVYRYTLSSGKTCEATSDVGYGDLSPDMQTGQTVSLLVFPNDPDQARPAGNVLFGIIGGAVCGAGVLFLSVALQYPLTKMTFVMLAGIAAIGIVHLQKIFFPQEKRIPLAQWKAQSAESAAKDRADTNALPIQPIEQALSSSAPLAQQKLQAQLPGIHKMHIILLGGAYLFFIIAFVKGYQTFQLVHGGVVAQGTIVSYKEVWDAGDAHSTGHYDYYPVVTFPASNGQTIQFQDKTGSRSPSQRAGKNVSVLYIDSDPQNAMIDHGAANWLPIGGLALVGALFLLFANRTSTAYVTHALSNMQNQRIQQTRTRKQVAIILIILGPIFIIAGIYMGQQTLELTRNGVRADGIVMSLDGDMSGHNTTYHAVVNFTASEGQTIRFRDGSGSNPPMYHTGEKVTVLYLPSQPERSATIDHGIWNWIGPGAFFAFGAIMAMLGPGMLRKAFFAPK